MLGDSHDAFSTGYGSGRSESRVSTATYSRRHTLSAVSPSSGLTRSGGLRRPKRDRTQSLSPAAPDRNCRASISPVDDYSTASERLSVPRSGSQVSFRSPVPSVGYESASEGSQGVSTYGSIGYDICETSDTSEFAIDQTGSRTRSRTATSGTGRVFDTVQSCPSTDFETVTVCPPSTEYDDARKCICPPSVEEVVKIVESPEPMETPAPVPIELTPPPSQRASSRRTPSEFTLERETTTETGTMLPPIPIELTPPPSQRASSRRTPSELTSEQETTTETGMMQSPIPIELTPPPSPRPSSRRTPSELTLERESMTETGTMRSPVPIELSPPPS
ncbi:hypothetical protein FRC06_007197 [Ceratobasidium sp. 370]|nr:hypothetical protein FRC06_007197 [Ceratobasidium sp. 370]